MGKRVEQVDLDCLTRRRKRNGMILWTVELNIQCCNQILKQIPLGMVHTHYYTIEMWRKQYNGPVELQMHEERQVRRKS